MNRSLRTSLLLVFLYLMPFMLKAQTPVAFVIDTTATDNYLYTVLSAPNGKTVLLRSVPNGNTVAFKATVIDSAGTILNTFDFTSHLTFQNIHHANTEVNGIVTSAGNLFITYTSGTSDSLLNQNASFILVNLSGTLLNSGTINTTNPGTILNRFIQLANLSNGKIAVVWQRSDNTGYAFRIFNADGTASLSADVPLAGPGSPYPFGNQSIYNMLVSASTSGGFLVTLWYYNGPLKMMRIDNTGSIQQVSDIQGVDPSASFSNYTNAANVSLSNGNYLTMWARNSIYYYSIFSGTGTAIVNAHLLPYPATQRIGTAVAVNTPGSQGFIISSYVPQTPGDYSNPYSKVLLTRYNLSGDSLSSALPLPFLINPTAFLYSGQTKGYGMIYSYYKSYIAHPVDQYYEVTSDNDVKGLLFGIASGAPLPLTLLDFSGKATIGGNTLQWQTAAEIDTKIFNLEKSKDGKTFLDIAGIAAAGTGSHAYQYFDAGDNTSDSYYRLRMTDIDGKATLSKVIWIPGTYATQNTILTYPNPVHDKVTIAIQNNDPLAGTTAQLFNGTGTLVRSFVLDPATTTLTLNDLPQGIYLLKLANGKVTKLTKE